MNTRVVIEQAKGMVSEGRRATMEDAFAMLRAHSRNNNVRLVDVARDIIERRLDAVALMAGSRQPAPRPSA